MRQKRSGIKQILKKAMYAPDLGFSFQYDKNIKKEKNIIVISVNSLEIRENLKKFEEQYNDFIKRIIIKFDKRNYDMYLFSFSEFEKDGKAINKIMEILPEKYKNKVQIISFNNDIEIFLEQYAKWNIWYVKDFIQ